MKTTFFLLFATAGVAIAFLAMLVRSVILRRRSAWLAPGLLLIATIALGGYTAFVFLQKSAHRLGTAFAPRTGDEIYDALFGKRRTDCVRVGEHVDQVIPKVDYAIWLHATACPEEMRRILGGHPFSARPLPVAGLGHSAWIPGAEGLDWFRPERMGDTIIVYEWANEDRRNIQTIWAKPDGTEFYCRDILD